MEKLFLKSVELTNGGYLTADGKPVYNEEFVNAQKRAEFLALLSDEVLKSNFKEVKVDSFQDITSKVLENLKESGKKSYIKKEEAPKLKLQDGLKDEALKFLEHLKKDKKSDRVNNMMQEFNILKDFEDFGLYFSTDNIVKLNRIFTVKEILVFMEILEPHLEA